MGLLNHRGDLAIAELVFYSPALPIALFVGFKHGFGKNAGWYFIIILSLLRLVGASIQVAVEVEQSQNGGLIAAAITMSAVGTGPLTLTTLGIIKRLYDEMRHKVIPARVFWLLGILPLIGLILAIVGGVNASGGTPKDLQGGVIYLQVAAILYTVVVILEIGVVAVMGLNLSDIIHAERKLYYAVVISLPFLLVRMIYAITAAYSWLNPDSPFNEQTGSIFVQAFMATMEEFICVAVYLAAGVLTDKKPPHREADYVADRIDARGESYKIPHATVYPTQQNGTMAV